MCIRDSDVADDRGSGQAEDRHDNHAGNKRPDVTAGWKPPGLFDFPLFNQSVLTVQEPDFDQVADGVQNVLNRRERQRDRQAFRRVAA